MPWQTVVVRALFVVVFTLACYNLHPLNLVRSDLARLLFWGGVGVFFVVFEMWLEKTSLKRLIGATVGVTLGILGALMTSHILALTTVDKSMLSFIQVGTFLVMVYMGLILGASKGDLLNLAALGGLFSGERPVKKSFKVLDTSVIIEGRIADVCETGFLDGVLIIPQFVLRELQMVADSSDSLKRNRGRRGLDILQRMQKMGTVQVQIVEDDFPNIRDVDMKLIELAKKYEAKIVTNDFNLNKVAQLQALPVLNINELANALKPVVLPGETMRVFILKEGKEYNQGVAYLDDGTMVVVDNAKKMISKTVDIAVTSVLQTTAGKMIFGKFDDRARAESPAHSVRNGELTVASGGPKAEG
jgi:uncharacterized protein YacL